MEMLRDDLAVVVCLHLSAIVIMTKVFTQDSHKSCFHSAYTQCECSKINEKLRLVLYYVLYYIISVSLLPI